MAELPSMRITFVHRRAARTAGWAAFAAAILPLLIYGALSFAGVGRELLREVAAVLDMGVLASVPLAALAFFLGRDFLGSAGTIRRDGDHLVIDKGFFSSRRIPLSSVREGIIVPEGAQVSVELHLADGNQVTARVAGVAEAEALLRSLRVDVENQRCRVQLADRTASMVIAMGAPVGAAYYLSPLFGLLFDSIPPQMVIVTAIGMYALAAALLRRLIALPDITIGTDGLAYRKGLRETFIPLADLVDVRMVGLGVKFFYRDGRTRFLRSVVGVSPARFEALMLRIREAMAARGAAPAQALAQLDRAGRSVAEWRAGLAALARRGVDYRGAGLSSDDLETLLGSADATPERRLAAAVALAASKHPDAPQRIRIAAGQCASEKLRVALEKVSEGEEDDAAIAEALEAAEPRHAS